MKKTYDEPEILIELFPGQDVITGSGFGGGGGNNDDNPDDPIIITGFGGADY